MSDTQTWHCTVCNEDHPMVPTVTACWVRDQRRISNLEVAVQRIEAQRQEDVTRQVVSQVLAMSPEARGAAREAWAAVGTSSRSTPPGVFPQMGPLVPSEGQCAYPMISGGVVCRLPPGHVGPHSVSWPESYHPAVGVATVDGKATCPKCPESVESRATYARVPEHAAPTTGFVSASCMACGWRGEGEPQLMSHIKEAHGRELGSLREVERSTPPPVEVPCPPTPAEAAIFERGGYVPGDDAEKAAFRKATEERMTDMTRRIYEADHRQTCEPRPVGPIAGLDAMLPSLTPAAMLGEAVEHLRKAEALMLQTRLYGPGGHAMARLAQVVEAVERDIKKRTRCPRGIHGGPGSDACDCAASGKAEGER